MSTLTVLTVGVCLGFSCIGQGLQAADIPAEGRTAEWSSKQQAARSALERNDYGEAIRLFDECVGLAKTDGERLTAIASYGIALNRADRNAEAKSVLEQALAEWTANGKGAAVVSYVLAVVDRSLGDYRAAERVLRSALSDPSTTHGNRAEMEVDLADLLREEAHGNEAEALLDDAVQITGLSSHERLRVLTEKAELDLDLHLWDESRKLWGEIRKIGGSEDWPLEADVDGGLGESWMAEGNLARAEPLLRKSLQLYRSYPGSSPLQIATALASMARLYLNEDKLALADEALTEAIAKDERSLGPGHPQIAALLELRALMLSRHGEAQEARNELERARSIMANHFGPESIPVAMVDAGLGDVELRANQPEAAVLQFKNALRLFREAGVDHSGPGLAVVARYSAALKAANRSDAARALVATSGSQSFREK